jgi:hypothetical protein
MDLPELAYHAGFFAAHGIWCVAPGETLIPMLVHCSAGAKPTMQRLVSAEIPAVVEQAKAKLASDAQEFGGAILVYDTIVTLGDWRTDAVLIEAVTPIDRLTVAIPYRPKKFLRRFRVYKPKFLGCPDSLVEQMVQKFWDGVGSHEKANKVWSSHIDQSR